MNNLFEESIDHLLGGDMDILEERYSTLYNSVNAIYKKLERKMNLSREYPGGVYPGGEYGEKDWNTTNPFLKFVFKNLSDDEKKIAIKIVKDWAKKFRGTKTLDKKIKISETDDEIRIDFAEAILKEDIDSLGSVIEEGTDNDEVETFDTAYAELDYLVRQGAIISKSDFKLLEAIYKSLAVTIKDLKQNKQVK